MRQSLAMRLVVSSIVVASVVVAAPLVALVMFRQLIWFVPVERVLRSRWVGVKFLGRDVKQVPVRLTATVLNSALTPTENDVYLDKF